MACDLFTSCRRTSAYILHTSTAVEVIVRAPSGMYVAPTRDTITRRAFISWCRRRHEKAEPMFGRRWRNDQPGAWNVIREAFSRTQERVVASRSDGTPTTVAAGTLATS